MIISRTPFRMSFIGGGTDLPSFYEKTQGAAISTTIDKYVYITANPRFDSTVRVSYSKTEIVKESQDLQHSRFRVGLMETNIHHGIEVTSIADVPSGTGLGSSSSFTVGLMNTLHAYHGLQSSAEDLAQEACELEMETLGEPIGKQDQYAAAYGGFRRYLFNSDGSVQVDPIIVTPKRRRDFFDHLMLFYVGGSRDAAEVLKTVNPDNSHLTRLRGRVDDFFSILTSKHDLMNELGLIMHAGWEDKKQMGGVTNPQIDSIYDTARAAGAIGGKILGAGQAGFLLLFCPPRFQSAVRNDLWYTQSSNPREIPFQYESRGSQIIYAGEN
jgi:D-glycero-alpha-D-manno-heptose-7-phosphate kinase